MLYVPAQTKFKPIPKAGIFGPYTLAQDAHMKIRPETQDLDISRCRGQMILKLYRNDQHVVLNQYW